MNKNLVNRSPGQRAENWARAQRGACARAYSALATLWCVIGPGLTLAQLRPISEKEPVSTTRDAAQSIAEALTDHRVVAIGENHGHEQFHAWLLEILHQPAVRAVVDDLVVEWANARHQPTLDAYIGGEEVDPAELRRIWLDTISSPNPVWDPPVYEQFFAAVRRINAERTDGRAYRVVAGGSPVEWDTVHTAADLRRFDTTARELFEATRDEVLRKGRRGLLLAGAAHVSFANTTRTAGSGLVWAEVTPVAELELHFPGAVFAIRSMGRAGAAYRPEQLAAKPGEILALTPGLGALPANDITLMRNFDGTPFTLYGEQTLGEMVDAIVYWGSAESFRSSEPDACRYRDDTWWSELNRRAEALSGRRLPEAWRADC